MIDNASPSRDIHIAADGTMFLTGGRHEVIRLFTGERKPARESPKTFGNNIRGREEYCTARNIHFESFIFPDKVYAQRHLLSTDVGSVFKSAYADQPGVSTCYLDGELASCESPFPRTDTHYSVAGNTACAARIVRPMFPGEVPGFLQFVDDNTVVSDGFSGDLGRKFDPPVVETCQKLRRIPSLTVESNGMTSGNDGLLMIASNPAARSSKRALLFADSYFRALLPYLGYFFSDIVFCRTRFFHYELVEAVAPDAIFTGMAERYLSRCEADAERPHFLAYPLLKGRSLSPTEGFAAAFAASFDPAALAGTSRWRG